jgi:transposase
VELSASHIQHMQKALMQMNVQVHHVVSDIMGVTGLRILRAIVAGERDPGVLAANRDRRCRADVETIQRALTGTWRAEHLFALEQALALYDTCQEKVVACDRKIEATLKRIEAQSAKPTGELPPARRTTRQPNAVDFDVRTALHAVLGVDLTQIHGLGPYLALKLVGECGTDLSAWPALHLLAWPGAEQQDLRGEGSVLANAPFQQPGGVAVAAGSGDGRTDGYGAGRLLPPLVGPCRQSQGRHRHGSQDRGALLQHPAPWDGLCRSRRFLLRGALPAEGPDQPPEAGEVAGLRPPTG